MRTPCAKHKRPGAPEALAFLLTVGCGNDASPGSLPDARPSDASIDASTQVQDSGGSGADAEGAADAGTGGGCKPFVMPADCMIPEGSLLPSELRCTGLYADWETRSLACNVRAYEPAYELWSDGAEKQRYVSLPEGATIDVSDPDDFVYPVGTQFWKEFRSASGQLLETRLLRKVDQPALGWLYTTYVWSEDGQTTVQTNTGLSDLHGTGHAVPTRDQCAQCHEGRNDIVLGWDMLMLGEGASGVTRGALAAEGRLRDQTTGSGEPTAAILAASIPGDATERAALGYLHANCGVSCHNANSLAEARDSGLRLRLELGELGSVSDTGAVKTGLRKEPSENVKLDGLSVPPDGFVALAPLEPERSLVLARMKVRGAQGQMPSLGTNQADPVGIAQIEAWIQHMTAERGY